MLKLYFSWYSNESMDLKKTHGIEIDSWYIIRLMVQTWTHGLDMDSWYIHGLMVLIGTHGVYMVSWYRHGLMVLTTPMVLTQTHGIDNMGFVTDAQTLSV